MGQLNHDLYIQHFSHPHTLELSNAQTNPPRAALTPSICAACKLPSSGWMYTCKQCIATFTLHASCSQMPTLITHPSHTKHALTLLAKPAYSAGFFYCDACGCLGNGFSYHCAECDFDVHATCASKPLSVSHHMHYHQLQMEFFPPYDTRGFSCDICRSTGANHWLYRCAFCEFDAHLDCATSRTLIQTQAHAQTQAQAQAQAQAPAPAQAQAPAQSQRPQAIGQQQWPQHVQNPAQPQVSIWPQQQQQVQTWPQQQQQQQVQTRPQQQQQVQTGPQQQQQVQTWPQQQQQVQTCQQQQQQIPVQPQAQQQVQKWPQQQQVQAVQPQLQNYPQVGGANQYQYQNTTFPNNNQPQGMNNYNMPDSTMGSVQNQPNGQTGQVGNNSLASQAYNSFVNAVFDQAGQMLVQNLLGGNNGTDGGGSSGSSSGNGGNVTDGGDVGDEDANNDGGQEDSSIGGSSFFGGIFSGSGGDSGDCNLD